MTKPTYEELLDEIEKLRIEVTRNNKSGAITNTLYEIAQSVSSSSDLYSLFKAIHTSLSHIVDTTNFYIALYHPSQKMITFEYQVDSMGDSYDTVKVTGSQSLTARVLETQKPLLITKTEILNKRRESGTEVVIGIMPEIWLGVPLITHDNIIGVMAVQSYENSTFYTESDVEMFSAVAAQTALAIERKQMEDKLQHSLSRFNTIIENVAAIAIQGYDEKRNVTFWNPASETLYGYTAEEALGKKIENLIIPEQMQQVVIDSHYKWIKEDTPIPAGEVVLINKDGEETPVYSSHIMHESDTGREMVCIDVDLRPIKQAEKSLRAANEKFTTAMNALNSLIYVSDINTYEILFINSFGEKTLGAKVGDTCWEALQKGCTGPCSFCTNDRLLDSNNEPLPPYTWEFQNTINNKWYRCQDQCIRWPDGRMVRLEIAFDITEQKETELQLQESEARFRTLHDAAFNGLCIHDGGTILENNQALVELTGYSKEELKSIDVFSLICPEYRALSRKNSDRGSTKSYVVSGLRKDNSTYDLLLKGKALFYQDRTVRVVDFCDISEQKETERTLITIQQRHEIIFENSPLGMIYFNDQGTIVDCNTNFVEMMGATKEKLVGFNTATQSTPQMQAAIKQAIAGQSAVFEDLYTSINGGKTCYLRTMFNPVTPNKSPSAVIATLEDISERKKAELDLQESALRFRTFFSAIQDAIFIHPYQNEDFTCFIEVNDIACERYGYTREELKKLTADGISTKDQAHVHKNHKHRRSLLEHNVSVIESTHCTKSGKSFPVEINSTIFQQNGQPFILSVVRDITERQNAEHERLRLESQLHHAQKMESIGRLAGGIAHDFNNMLGVIIGRTELIMVSENNWAPFAEDLDEINKAARRSADLTRQLLAFARKQTISPQVLDLDEKIRELLSMVRRLIGEDISLTHQPQLGLWPIKIDPGQIDQLLTNLCVNSRDALYNTSYGKITISTKNRVVEQKKDQRLDNIYSGSYVVLSVKDNGTGMSEEVMKKIFEPFFTTKEIGEGTGLGLATVYGISYQNKGFVETNSIQGEGSVFDIYFPAAATESNDHPVADRIASPTKQKRTILLVEDEKSILKLTKKILEHLGHTVFAFSAPEEALEMAKEYSGTLDLILTDVIMRGMDGLTLSKLVTECHPEIKCLFMSGYTNDILSNTGDFEDQALLLEKPCTKDEIAAKIHNLFTC